MSTNDNFSGVINNEYRLFVVLIYSVHADAFNRDVACVTHRYTSQTKTVSSALVYSDTNDAASAESSVKH